MPRLHKCVTQYLLVGLGTLIASCSANRSLTSSQAVQPSTPAAPCKPQDASDEEITRVAQQSLSLLPAQINEAACETRPGHVFQVPTNPEEAIALHNAPPITEKPLTYTRWLNYVADHIKSGKPFDATYDAIAAGALNDFAPQDPNGPTCQPPTPSHDPLSGKPTSTNQIGKDLFESFNTCAPDVRRRAADIIVKQGTSL